MPNDQENCWPRFKLVTFSERNGIPLDWAYPLMMRGVPKNILGRYKAAEDLTLVATSSHGQLICFGTEMWNSLMCLVPKTGEVISIAFIPDGPISLVNSSLEQFIAAASAVYDRFPFDSWTRDNGLDMFSNHDMFWDEWEIADRDLTAICNAIDPAIRDTDGFWRTLFDDIRIGDFATKSVLENC